MTSSIADRGLLWTVALACLVLFLSGCATTGKHVKVEVPPQVMEEYLSDKPERLQGMYAKVLTEGRRNFVLNHLQAGLAALEMGEIDLAEYSFEQALLNIEAVYANNPEATKARSLWHEEGAKDFKGEPYERAMAYYYRGLVFLIRGDYENARACFKSGMLQDAFAEEEQSQCDFALLLFLEGWASQRLGDTDLADTAFSELEKLRPDFERPPTDHNVLALIETGRSPRKVADGVGHAELKYRRGKKFLEERAILDLGSEAVTAYPMEDIYFQARTRGGRPIDKILEGQAIFLQRGTAIGTSLTDAATGVILAAPLLEHGAGKMADVGAAMGAVGGVVTLVAINAKPHADTRYWKNLPDIVHVMTFDGIEEEKIPVAFATADGAPADIPRRELELLSDGKGSKLLWGRSRSAILQ